MLSRKERRFYLYSLEAFVWRDFGILDGEHSPITATWEDLIVSHWGVGGRPCAVTFRSMKLGHRDLVLLPGTPQKGGAHAVGRTF